MTEFSQRIIDAIRRVPPGRVASYGQIARCAGSPRAARQVARILHSSSHVQRLPWHRILGADGNLRLSLGAGLEEQASLLRAEGVELSVSHDGKQVQVDMERYAYWE